MSLWTKLVLLYSVQLFFFKAIPIYCENKAENHALPSQQNSLVRHCSLLAYMAFCQRSDRPQSLNSYIENTCYRDTRWITVRLAIGLENVFGHLGHAMPFSCWTKKGKEWATCSTSQYLRKVHLMPAHKEPKICVIAAYHKYLV